MLKQTILSELSRLQEVGKATSFGVCLDQVFTSAGVQLLVVPKGQVFLITDVFLQASTIGTGVGSSPQSPEVASPDLAVYGIRIVDASANTSEISFLTFIRPQSVFEFQDSPNWRNAAPANIVRWRLKYPIPVPAGATVNSTVGGEFGNPAAVYGYFMGSADADALGYNTKPVTSASTRIFGVVSGSPGASGLYNELIPARAGYSIRLLDMRVRIQPRTGGATNRIDLRWDLIDDDTGKVFSFINNNPSDLVDVPFSPDGVYLPVGKNMSLRGTIASAASVTCTFEYVADAEVPGDAWWSFVEPNLPTPAVTKYGTVFSSIPAISTQITCFYPGRETTKTSPTKGYQHMLKGVACSVQKDATVVSDQLLLTVSTGAAAGFVELSSLDITQTNVQLIPTILAAQHDQNVTFALDGLNIPCKRDDGSIWVDAISILSNAALSTPTSTDTDTDEWAMTMWGRTIPNQFYNPENKGA